MYNIWKKIFLVGILGTVSAPVLAQEYDNYYVEYMYENYVGKRRARPVEFDIMEQNLQTNKGINLPTVDDNYLNAKNYDDKFYIQLNLGLNKFEKYNASFEEAPNNKADLKSDKNEMSFFLCSVIYAAKSFTFFEFANHSQIYYISLFGVCQAFCD